jgi:beta-galactosidase GanA
MFEKKAPYLGAAYYPEAWPESDIPADIERMKEAGCNCMRLAEFAWGNMEPEEGVFSFDWLHNAVDRLHEAGIAVVLCTPSATPPKWLTDKYGETLIMLDSGVRRQFGGRCHVCKSSEIMREKNRIIVTEMCREFKGHPAVIGWQIDNELYPYEDGCFCPLCKAKFIKYIQKKYGTVENLNQKWGTARWSLQYSSFDDVIPPRSDTWSHPSLKVEWARFQSENGAEYIDEQAEIIHSYFSVPAGTDMMPMLGQSYYRTNQKLDVVQLNHYDAEGEIFRPSFWFDFVRPIKDVPFWVTETQVTWNGSAFAELGYRARGNCYVNTWLPIAKGGEMNMYWLWKAHYAGHELGHGAVLSSAGRFCHAKPEIERAAREFESCRDILCNSKIKSDIALHFSETAWVNFKHAPLSKGMDYYKFLVENYHKPLRHYNVDVIDTPHDIDGYKIIISPYLACADEYGFKDRIIRWIENGGTWIVGPMSDVMTDYAAKYTAAPFSFLEELAGINTAFQMPIPNNVFKAKWKTGEGLEIAQVFDGFSLEGAKSLADYTNDLPEGLSAIAERKIGKGRVIVCGTMVGARDLLRLIDIEPIAKASENIELVARGKNIVVVIELENKEGFAELNGSWYNHLDGKTYSGKIKIPPYSVMVIEPVV